MSYDVPKVIGMIDLQDLLTEHEKVSNVLTQVNTLLDSTYDEVIKSIILLTPKYESTELYKKMNSMVHTIASNLSNNQRKLLKDHQTSIDNDLHAFGKHDKH